MAIVIRAVCPICEWSPEDELTLDTVRAHYNDAEDDDHTYESDADLKLDFRAYCPRDDTPLGKPTRVANHKDYQKLYFDCPKCKRTLTLKQPYAVPAEVSNA